MAKVLKAVLWLICFLIGLWMLFIGPLMVLLSVGFTLHPPYGGPKASIFEVILTIITSVLIALIFMMLPFLAASRIKEGKAFNLKKAAYSLLIKYIIGYSVLFVTSFITKYFLDKIK